MFKKFSRFVKKMGVTYLFYLNKLVKKCLKALIVIIYKVCTTPFYFLYLLLSAFTVVEKESNTIVSACCFHLVFILFFFSAALTVFYNNKWFAPLLENWLGLEFSKKYLRRSQNGVYMKPFFLLGSAFLGPFALELFTNSIDHYDKMTTIEQLYLKRESVPLIGFDDIKKKIIEEIIVIGETPSRGIISKLYIVTHWFITKKII